MALFSLATADLVRSGRRGGRRLGRRRQGRQDVAEAPAEIPGGVNFDGCVDDEETGLCCVEKEETITTIQKVRIFYKKYFLCLRHLSIVITEII